MRNPRQELRDKLVPRVRVMRANGSDAERVLWSRLRGRQLGGRKFRRQHPAGPFIANFACVEAMLIVEIDGNQHAADGGEYDQRRDAKLRGFGWHVMRFWADVVLRDTDAVCETILQSMPSPQPSPGVPGEGAKGL